MKCFVRIVAVIAAVVCVFAQRLISGRVRPAVTGAVVAVAVVSAVTGGKNRKKCPECSTVNRAEATFCATCGGKLA